jgi:beta-lactam-binding protein with PASTA domain
VVTTRLDDAARAVQARGLKIAVQVQPSDQPVGTVLAESPPAGTSLRTKDTVTLTVSGGQTGQ